MLATASAPVATGACPMCGGTHFRPSMRNLPELRFGLTERFSIKRCLTCDTYVTDPPPADDLLSRLYEEHYVPPEYAPPDRSQIAAAVAGLRRGDAALLEQWRWERSTEVPALFLSRPTAGFLPRAGQLLDVGAYTGANMMWLEAGGWDVVGVEPNPRAVAVGRGLGLDIRQGYLEDCRLPAERFDAAYLSYVIEHTDQPRALLLELHRVLKPGGKLLLTTHNVHSIWRYLFGPYWIHWHAPFHLYHPHPRALSAVAESAGFRIVYLATRTPTFWLLMSMRAARDGLFLRRPTHPRLYEPLTVPVAARLHRLLAIEGGRRQGDCIIAIFEKRQG